MLRSLLLDSGKLFLASVGGRLVGLLALPVVTHWATPAEYGQAALASTLTTLFGVVGLLGLETSYSREFFARPRAIRGEIADYCWTLAWASAVVAAVFAAVVWQFVAPKGSPTTTLSLLIAFGTLCSVTQAMALTRCRLKGNGSQLALATLAAGSSPALIGITLLALGIRAEVAILAGYVSGYVSAIAIAGVQKPNFGKSAGLLSKADKLNILKVGLPGLLTAPAYWMLSSCDRWFLNHFSDTSDVGKYAVAATIALSGLMVNSAVVAMWFPAIAKQQGESTFGTPELVSKHVPSLILIFALTWLVVAAFGGEAMRFLTATNYHSAATVIPILAAGIFFYGCYHAFNSNLFVERKMIWSAVAMLFGVFIAVLSNFLLVPRFGAVGAAASQAAGFAAASAAVFVFAAGKKNQGRVYVVLAAKLLPITIAGLLLSYPLNAHPVISAAIKSLPVAAICAITLFFQFKPLLVRAKS